MHNRSITNWLGWSYVALIALWLAGRVLVFDQFWWLALINTCAEYLFLPLPVLFAATLYRKHWQLLLGLSIPTLAFAVLFGRIFLPGSTSERKGEGRHLSVMTFNVATNNQDFAALVQSIRVANPDVIGFQELTARKKAAILTALGASYPYNSFTLPNLVQDVGVLSRFPIDSVVAVSLPPLHHALHATLRVDDTSLHVFVVHLSPNNLFRYPAAQFATIVAERYKSRAAEIVRIEEEVRATGAPTLLLCDCNLTDTSQAYAQLSTFVTDSFREAGWGFGHTLLVASLPFPVQRLDYVWHSDALVSTKARVGQSGGSDHLPVVVDMQFRNT